MNILLLPGALATKEIWAPMAPFLSTFSNADHVEYAHSTLETARSVAEIASDLSAQLPRADYDCIVGHSMGGLVALHLVETHGIETRSIILIETNLRPAEPFYRNLLLPENERQHKDAIMSMFRAEAPHYPDALKQTFQDHFDFTPHANALDIPIHVLMGDRGRPAYRKRIDDLNLDAETRRKLRFHFIKNACHLPMMENPHETANLIHAILTSCVV